MVGVRGWYLQAIGRLILIDIKLWGVCASE